MSTELADRIDTYLTRYARQNASYDPKWDSEDERFNGPDSAMLASAAQHLRAGRTPHAVFSGWEMSGCYTIPKDPEERKAARIEHDSLVSEINRLAAAAT